MNTNIEGNMTALSACVRSRRSVRSFDGAAVPREEAQRVLDFARRVDNPWDIPVEWRLLDARKHGLSSPVITGTECWLAGKLRRAEHAEEAFGYSMEKLVLFAESLGLGTTIIAGTMNRAAFEKAVELAADEVMPCVTPLGRPAKKMSLRETMMRKAISADTRLPFETLFFRDDFTAPLTPEAAGELRAPLELVRLAPSAVNKQPWRVLVKDGAAHFYEERSKGYVGEDGWDLQRIDLGIALCHYELGLRALGRPAALRSADPGLSVGERIYVASFLPEAEA